MTELESVTELWILLERGNHRTSIYFGYWTDRQLYIPGRLVLKQACPALHWLGRYHDLGCHHHPWSTHQKENDPPHTLASVYCSNNHHCHPHLFTHLTPPPRPNPYPVQRLPVTGHFSRLSVHHLHSRGFVRDVQFHHVQCFECTAAAATCGQRSDHLHLHSPNPVHHPHQHIFNSDSRIDRRRLWQLSPRNRKMVAFRDLLQSQSCPEHYWSHKCRNDSSSHSPSGLSPQRSQHLFVFQQRCRANDARHYQPRLLFRAQRFASIVRSRCGEQHWHDVYQRYDGFLLPTVLVQCPGVGHDRRIPTNHTGWNDNSRSLVDGDMVTLHHMAKRTNVRYTHSTDTQQL